MPSKKRKEILLVRFPYSKLAGLYKPTASIYIFNGSTFWSGELLIDSGADISVISKRIGNELGLRATSKDTIQTFSGFAGEAAVIIKPLIVKIAGEVLKIKIAWALEETNIPAVIGRQDIFDYFNVEFRQKEKMTIFKKS